MGVVRAGKAIAIAGVMFLVSACAAPIASDSDWLMSAAGACTCDGTTLDCNPKSGRFTMAGRSLEVGNPAPPFENSTYCSIPFLGEAQTAGYCTCNGDDLVCEYSVYHDPGDNVHPNIHPPAGSSVFSQTFTDSELCVPVVVDPTETPTEVVEADGTETPTPTATDTPTVTVGATCQSGFVFVGGECVKACESNADCGSDEACSASGACAASTCGDGICGNDENTDLCSADCQCADDGVCGQGEGSTCNDCLPTPGGGTTGGGSTTGGGDTGGNTGGGCVPIPEICANGVDDDCNGLVDDGC